jgi:hypothetical protein
VKLSQSAVLASILVLAAGIAVYLLVFSGSNRYDDFAKCLNASGAKMYGAWWCPHCNDQKAMFGDSWKYINYIECSNADGSAQTEICRQADVKSYPTWEFKNGTRHVGLLSFADLSQRTGCPLE